MKTYKYKNEIIREDELKEIQLPKVGDRFRVKRDRLCSAPMKSGDVITTNEIDDDMLIYDTHGWAFNVSEIGDGLEPIPSPPVCPPELMPLPEGAVYCGLKCAHGPKWLWHDHEWKEGLWAGEDADSHYATTAGDACHRSQAWFSEDQVPEPPTQYPPPESEWPEKPEPPEGCVWVRQGHTGIHKTGDISLMSNMKSQLEWETSEFDGTEWFGTVVFRAVPIDHTEGGKYRMLEVGKDVLQEGDEVRDEPWGHVAKIFWGNKVMIDDTFRRPVKSDLQEKLAQLKILVDEIGKLNKSEV